MKRKVILWSGGALLFAAVFQISFFLAGRDSMTRQGAYFAGIANGLNVTVSLADDLNDCVAWVVETQSSSAVIQLHGARHAVDGTLVFERDNETERLELRLTATAPMTAEIRLESATDHRAVAVTLPLAKIADRFVTERRGGLRMFGLGARAVQRSSVPQFEGDSQLAREVNERLRNFCHGHAREFARVDLDTMRDGFVNPSYLYVYECVMRWIPLHKTKRMVSVAALHWEYTGGAHGNSWFETLTLVRDGDKVKEVQLTDLFRQDSDWQNLVSQLLIDDLKKQGASSVVDGGISGFTDEDLVFAVDEGGLIFFFAPYAVGCYAEGDYVVRLPFAQIRSVLRKNILSQD